MLKGISIVVDTVTGGVDLAANGPDVPIGRINIQGLGDRVQGNDDNAFVFTAVSAKAGGGAGGIADAVLGDDKLAQFNNAGQ